MPPFETPRPPAAADVAAPPPGGERARDDGAALSWPRSGPDGDGGDPTARDEVWLLGQPPLNRYLHHVRTMAVDGAQADPRALCDEWRDANDRYHELEKSEAGIADGAECRDLDPALGPLAEAVQANPRFRHVFGTLPVRLGVVELDRLVVFQPHVTLPFVEALRARLGPVPLDPEALFRFCLPLDRPSPPIEVRRLGPRHWTFASESSDLRFHEPVLLEPARVAGLEDLGPVSKVLGVAVGFGNNMLNVLRSGTRIMLQNGYHRACALRASGVTHAPCVIQEVTRRDELQLVATREVAEEPAFFFKAARPPLLKDFFDPALRKVLKVRRAKWTVEVSLDIRDYTVAE